MKRLITYIFTGCLILAGTFAAKAQQPDAMEKIQVRKTVFFNEKLQLAPEEAKKFWPIYNDYTNRRNHVNQQRNNLVQYYMKNEKNLSEKETAEVLNKFIGFQKTETELMEAYTKKFREFLPETKVVKIYVTEIQFKRWLLSQSIQPRPNKR